ncbi:hypothetical protein MMC22_009130 [Lobaria immixta]|nr:hypothetical protein [Lobaria immixta]
MPPTTRNMTARGVVAPREYAVQQKKPRKIKPSPASIKHGQIGFDRKGLQTSGALESDAAKPPSLANEVLGLFGKHRFVFDGGNPPAEWDEAYENMKPAFSLVSRWMTEPKFQSFWDTLLHGQVGTAINVHRSAQEKRIMLDEDEFRFGYLDKPECYNGINHQFRFKPISHAWAETRSQSVPDIEQEETVPEAWMLGEYFASTTFLHEDFLHLSYTEFPQATTSQQVRFLYFLAITVAHEVAHLTWQHGWAMEISNAKKPVLDWEPYFYLDDAIPRDFNHDELGIAWECFMFGGRIQPLNQSASPFVPVGLAVLPMNMVLETHFWDPQCRIAPLETAWISNQFSEAYWQRYGRRGKPGRPCLAPIRATVNRTIDSRVFRNNEYDVGGEAQRVADHIVGGCPGHRFVSSMDDTWMLTGVVRSLWQNTQSETDGSD